MNLKLTALIAGLMLVAAGCAPDNHSVTIRNAIGGQPTPDCTVSVDETIQKSGGAIDVGLTGTYLAAFLVENHLNTVALTAAGEEINDQSKNDFHITEVELTYEGVNAKVDLKQKTIPAAGTVTAGGKLAMGLDLFTPDNIERLRNTTLPDGGLDVNVQVVLRGEFVHQRSFETEPFSFPVTVTNRYCEGTASYLECLKKMTTTCTEAGYELATSDTTKIACGNLGQDGSGLYCAPKGTTGQ